MNEPSVSTVDVRSEREEAVLHTPGPWHRGSDDLASRELWSDVIAANGFIVARATLDRGANSKERDECQAITRANADLMAAAPDLLAALKAIVAQYNAVPDGPLGKGFTNGPFLHARYIIAKATGEAA